LMTRFLIVLWNLSGGGIEIGRLSQAEIWTQDITDINQEC
jgi:hypothetical protein